MPQGGCESAALCLASFARTKVAADGRLVRQGLRGRRPWGFGQTNQNIECLSRHRLLSRHAASSRPAGVRGAAGYAHERLRSWQSGPKKTVAGKKGVKDMKGNEEYLARNPAVCGAGFLNSGTPVGKCRISAFSRGGGAGGGKRNMGPRKSQSRKHQLFRAQGRKVRRCGADRGVAHIKATFNNTTITVTDTKGDVLCWAAAGTSSSWKAAARALPLAGQMSAQQAGRQGDQVRYEGNWMSRLMGPAAAAKGMTALQAAGLKICRSRTSPCCPTTAGGPRGGGGGGNPRRMGRKPIRV